MRLGFIWFFGLLFVEIWSIIKMSDYVGGLATFILLVAGFIFGLQLMRSQGINALAKASQNMQSAESPLAPLAEGIVKAFAGILLIIPGFFSDIAALVILLPFVRKSFARYLAKKGQFQGFAAGNFGQGGFGGAFGSGGFGGFGRAGARSANDDFAGGNVYDHDGSTKVDEDSSGKLLEGQVIELKPKDK
jgi:UPF0716 family protein affecting phage T7 exclusion